MTKRLLVLNAVCQADRQILRVNWLIVVGGLKYGVKGKNERR